MADVFYTVLIVWVLWRIFGGTTKTHVFHHNATEKKEGKTTISPSPDTSPKRKPDDGEYVDFEEIK